MKYDISGIKADLHACRVLDQLTDLVATSTNAYISNYLDALVCEKMANLSNRGSEVEGEADEANAAPTSTRPLAAGKELWRLDLLNYAPEELAQQLCLIEQENLRFSSL